MSEVRLPVATAVLSAGTARNSGMRCAAMIAAVLTIAAAKEAGAQVRYQAQPVFRAPPQMSLPPQIVRPMPGSTPMMMRPAQPAYRPPVILQAPAPARPNFATPVVPFQTGPHAYTPPVPVNPAQDTGFFAPNYIPGHQHLGVDLPAPAGTPVRAPFTGQVTGYYPDRTNPANSFVVMQPNGTTTQNVYGHVTCPTCYPGQPITQGAPFGATVAPNPEGAHVHWGANYQGVSPTASGGWGWGMAPATATPAQAQMRGWFNPLQGPNGGGGGQ